MMRTQFIDPSRECLSYLPSRVAILVLVGPCTVFLWLLISWFGMPVVLFGTIAAVLSSVVIWLRWPYGALAILTIASVMPRVSLEIGGWNSRPEHWAALLIFLVFLLRWIFGKRQRIALTGTDYLLAAYVVWNYVSSAFTSPDPRLTLRWALLNNLVVLPYFFIRLLVGDRRVLKWVFRVFIIIGIAECAFAIISFSSQHLFGTAFGIEVGQYAEGFGGVYGTQFEPNLLGSFAGCISIMLFVLYFISNRRILWFVAGLVIALGALLVSLSRAALLSFGFALVVVVFFSLRMGLIQTKRLLPLSLCLVVFVTPFVLTGGRNLATRFTNFSEVGVQDDSETMVRLVAWTAAIEDIQEHPLIGNGTASFQLLADAKQLPILGDRPWIGNSIVRIVHDSGTIGLLLFGAVAVGIARNVKKVIAEKGPGRDMVIALAAGCLVYAGAFMATEGTILAFFWVHLGLLASACTIAQEDVAG